MTAQAQEYTSTQSAVVSEQYLQLPSLDSSISSHPCTERLDRRSEVCIAYTVNASVGSRLLFYKYGRSLNDARASAALHRLESRYSGQALAYVINQVADWPRGNVNVSAPTITILSVTVTKDQNYATLRTQEDWTVQRSGNDLLSDEGTFEVHMQRVEGLFLHKWIVTAIQKL